MSNYSARTLERVNHARSAYTARGLVAYNLSRSYICIYKMIYIYIYNDWRSIYTDGTIAAGRIERKSGLPSRGDEVRLVYREIA